MTDNHTVRILGGQTFEIRNSDDEGPGIVGYAAVFDVETDIGGAFREKILPGAFGEALKTSDVHALYNHDYGHVLGRSKSGTLRLEEDKHGLKIKIDLPDTNDARDLATKIERGDIDEMSFSFSMQGGIERWDNTGEVEIRIIEQVGELFDVSICPRGAYPTTGCGLRSYDDYLKSKNYHAASRRVRMKMNLALKERENGT